MPAVQVLPRPATILGDLMTTLAYEASRLSSIAQRKKLPKADRQALVDFSRALAILSAEDERMRKADAVAALTDDQLRDLAAKLLVGGT